MVPYRSGSDHSLHILLAFSCFVIFVYPSFQKVTILVVVSKIFTLQGFREYRKFEECIAYIENYMIRHGPFDGILGFSQVGGLEFGNAS